MQNPKVLKEVPCVEVDYEIIAPKNYSGPKPLFSAFHFNKKGTSTGYVQSYSYKDRDFLTGRHIYTNDICIKGAGITELYNSSKERKILGGLSLTQAAREYVISNILFNSGIRCVRSVAIGYLLKRKDHFFCIRKASSLRLSSKYVDQKIMLDSITINNLVSLWESIYKLFCEGIVHTSLNEDNINLNGEIIDCESFFRVKSNKNICINLTFEVEGNKCFDPKNDLERYLCESTLKYSYLYDIFKLLVKSGVPDSSLFDKHCILKYFIDPKLLLKEKVDIHTSKVLEINERKLHYIEFELLSLPQDHEIKKKKYISLLHSNLLVGDSNNLDSSSLGSTLERMINE